MAAEGHVRIHNGPGGEAAAPEVAVVAGPAAQPEVFIAQPEVATARPAPPVDVTPPLVPAYQSPRELHRLRRLQREALEVGGNEVAIAELPPIRDAAEGSFGETTILEVVIGVDDRVAVEDGQIRSNPWRQICALRIHASSGTEYVGTAWFIAPNVLATAGHCVYLRDDGGWATSIDVIPGMAGGLEPYGRATSTRFASVDGWRDTGGRDFDYGVIFLDGSDLGARVGNFGVEAQPDADLVDAVSRISGYPSDRDRATRQYYHERPLKSVSPTRINYDIDTFGGQSGSPIWRQIAGVGAVAVGIHTTGTATGNSGTRITEDVLENLVAWTGEAP